MLRALITNLNDYFSPKSTVILIMNSLVFVQFWSYLVDNQNKSKEKRVLNVIIQWSLWIIQCTLNHSEISRKRTNVNILVSYNNFYMTNCLGPFASELRISILSTACDIFNFNVQRQLCPLTCAEWRDLSNHTRMSIIQVRTPEKKAKKHVTLTWKFSWKSSSTTQLPFLSSNPIRS